MLLRKVLSRSYFCIYSTSFVLSTSSIPIKHSLYNFLDFPGSSVVKNLPAMQEGWVRSLFQEDPLEKGMSTPSSILAWRIPWTEKPGGLQSTGLQRVRHD